MAAESTFDIVSEIDHQELANAVDQALREIRTRYDLKDSNTEIEVGKGELTITSSSEMFLASARDLLESKAIRRGLSLKIFDFGEAQEIGGMRVKQVAKLREGIAEDLAKKLQKLIKEQVPKVQARIQGDTLRVGSKSRDDLQAGHQAAARAGRRVSGAAPVHKLSVELQETSGGQLVAADQANTEDMKYHLITLGCPKNSVDSEGMHGLLLAHGHQAVDASDGADVVIVNTCSFIAAARDETVGVLQSLAKQKTPGQRLIAAGCMAESHPERLLADVAGLDATLSTKEWMRINEVVSGAARPGAIPMFALTRQAPAVIPLAAPGQSLIPLSAAAPQPSPVIAPLAADGSLGSYGDWRTTPITRHTSSPSAYLKISDGCNLRCAFCSIPSFKGDMRSKAVGAILGEAQALVAAGVQEIVLVAQHLTDYGRDLKLQDGLAVLLGELAQVVPSDRWVRLMYAYPQSITPGVMEALATYPQLCRYLDMPLQHAHPDTLRRMRRPPDTAKTARLLQDLRAAVPDIALRTTFIVGFPGETRTEFQALLDFLEELRFDRAGFFKYSQEPGTPAALLDGQVSERVKQRRFDEASALQQRIAQAQNRRWVGRTLRVLVEGQGQADDGSPVVVGRSFRDAPEIDGLVWAHGQAAVGTFAEVQVERATDYDLWGSLVPVTAGAVA